MGVNARRTDGTPFHGGVAELCAVPAVNCHRLPDGVDDLRACSVEPLACGTRSVRLARVAPADTVVLLGAEDYNMASAQWVVRNGADRVVAVDPLAVRRTAAEALGLLVLDPARADVAAEIGGRFPDGADWVFVAHEGYVPESDAYLATAVQVARVQGTVVVNRAYSSEPYVRIDPFLSLKNEVTIRHFGVFWGEEPARGGRARGDYAVAIEGLAEGVLNGPAAYRPEVVSFDDLRTAAQVDELLRGVPHGAQKTVLRI